MLIMLHLLLSIALVAAAWLIAPATSLFYLALIFIGAFLIDADHYIASSLKTKKWGLSESFKYHRKKRLEEKRELTQGVKKKSDFHLFHTIEFHVLIGLFAIFWLSFFYLFIGMVFHSLLDVLDLLRRKAFHRREYFFFNWVRKSKQN